MNYYNENDPKAAAWLRELVRAELIPPGVVDETSITEIKLDELGHYTQCHFFAGIGGWSYALWLAGWPDDKPVWTGSCPCQPFSAAGRGQVDKDERHLWPAFRAAIEKCRPSVCFGEQVASADGRIWLAGVRTDLEALGYGVGAADLCAAGVAAPQKRQRLFWVADSNGGKPRDGGIQRGGEHGLIPKNGRTAGGLGCSSRDGREMRQPENRELRGEGSGEGCATGGLDNSIEHGRRTKRHDHAGNERIISYSTGDVSGLAIPKGEGRSRVESERAQRLSERTRPGSDSATVGMGHATERRSGAFSGRSEACIESQEPAGGSSLSRGLGDTASGGCGERRDEAHARWGGYAVGSSWARCDIIPCRDGKARRVESGTFPLAHGIPGRVGLLRGYGNAIVPQVAAEFIQASCDALFR